MRVGTAPLPSQVGTVDGYRSDAHTQQTLAYVGYAVGAVALADGAVAVAHGREGRRARR